MSLPGCALATALKSFTDFTLSDGVTTRMFVLKPICETPTKSFSGSYGRAACIAVAIDEYPSLALTVAMMTRPGLQRPDWRAVAAEMGPITSARAVIADASGAEPLRLYLPDVALGAASSPTVIREIALVRHISHVGPYAGCRRLRCLPASPPASAADAATLGINEISYGLGPSSW